MCDYDKLRSELNDLIQKKNYYWKIISEIDGDITEKNMEIGRCSSSPKGGKKHRTKRYKKSRRHKRRATRRNRLQRM
jgi:hypothetical protein